VTRQNCRGRPGIYARADSSHGHSTHCPAQPSALLAGPVVLPIFQVEEHRAPCTPTGGRPSPSSGQVRPKERIVMSMLQRLRPASERVSSLVTPDTLRRWHRELVRRKWTRPHRVDPRRTKCLQTQLLVWRIAKETHCGITFASKGICSSLASRSRHRVSDESSLQSGDEVRSATPGAS
jgi:hypothetical protein